MALIICSLVEGTCGQRLYIFRRSRCEALRQDDYDTEIELRSLAIAAVGNPEYAISIDRFILAHANRADDPKDYDFVSNRLAFALLDRSYDVEALESLTRSTPNLQVTQGMGEPCGCPTSHRPRRASFGTLPQIDQSGSHSGVPARGLSQGTIQISSIFRLRNRAGCGHFRLQRAISRSANGHILSNVEEH